MAAPFEPGEQFEQVIRLLTHNFADLESKALHESGLAELSMKQIVCLDTIARLERPTFSELALNLGVSKPSVTAIIAKLLSKGYVQKIQSEADRRVSHVLLTDKGRQLSQAHQNFHRKIAQHFAGVLDPLELQQLGRLLYKVVKAGVG
jgi:DNA-binding MarR family transcriptional regulator